MDYVVAWCGWIVVLTQAGLPPRGGPQVRTAWRLTCLRMSNHRLQRGRHAEGAEGMAVRSKGSQYKKCNRSSEVRCGSAGIPFLSGPVDVHSRTASSSSPHPPTLEAGPDPKQDERIFSDALNSHCFWEASASHCRSRITFCQARVKE